ncbi:MAG: STT3 domain-containing protein [Candidatus Burarchaeum sp.]|nr:STT3 domain-containing protein [Candidatus Burarchaeum sp.]MDO8339284.1 STT3 domain-containing protein [Candidatus Burarchaeum sp.]
MELLQLLLPSVLILITAGIPGFFLSARLFKKSSLGFPERLGIGIAIGIVVLPALAWLESLFGIPFSQALYFLNLVVLTVVGLLLCRQAGISLSLSKLNFRRELQWFILIGILLFAVYMRMQAASETTAGAELFEYDPFYYTQLTRFIVQDGGVPASDDLAWQPYASTHRNPALAYYLGAQWNYLVNGNAKPDADVLWAVQSLYPPIMALLMVFFAFLLIKEYYGGAIGLIGAAMLATAPIIVSKTTFGVNELAPWSLFGLLFFYTSYTLLISKKEFPLAVLSGLALSALILGSKSGILAVVPLTAYMCLQGLLDYRQGKLDRQFLNSNLVVLAFAFISGLLLDSAYLFVPLKLQLMGMESLALMGSAAVIVLLWLLQNRIKRGAWAGKAEMAVLFPIWLVERLRLLSLDANGDRHLLVLLAFGMLLIFVTPLWSIGYDSVSWVFTQASLLNPLDKAIGENVPPSAEILSQSVGSIIGFLAGFVKGLLFGNSGILSSVPGLFVFSAATALALGYAWKRDKRHLAFLILALALPLMMGLDQTKYVIYFACAAVLGTAVLIGEAAPAISAYFSGSLGKTISSALPAALGLLILLSVAQPAISAAVRSADSSYYVNADGKLLFDCSKIQTETSLSYELFCLRIPPPWIASMSWIRENTSSEEKVAAFWDWGHWINYFGERKTIARNDNVIREMSMESAYLLAIASQNDTAARMRSYGANYLLLSSDLLTKWPSVDYLACSYANRTSANETPGKSECEAAYRPEVVFLPFDPTSADACSGVSVGGAVPLKAKSSISGREYCVVGKRLNDAGSVGYVAYVQQGGTLVEFASIVATGESTRLNGRNYANYMVVYVEGTQNWEYRTTGFYDSVYYRGFFLGHLDGFVQAYPYYAEYAEKGGLNMVRIYELKKTV